MVRNRAGTDDVRAMYEAFPYPGPHDGPIYDVANNLAVLFPGQTLEGKRILDAGCGSGQRLLGAATRYPKAEFWGIDMTLASLDVARRAADRQSLGNVHLEQANLLDLHLSTTFDIIVSTGVIHHLEDPRRGLANVCSLLSENGVLIVWLYHALGEHQRLCDRELFLALWGSVSADREEGLKLLRDLKLSVHPRQYGRSAAPQHDDVSQIHLDVDAYMHPIVNAYRFGEALELFAGCPVDWAAINGINLVESSKLIDLAERETSRFKAFTLRAEDLFDEDVADRQALADRYRKLDHRTKLRVIELRLRPTGFTILGGRGVPSTLGSRIAGNLA